MQVLAEIIEVQNKEALASVFNSICEGGDEQGALVNNLKVVADHETYLDADTPGPLAQLESTHTVYLVVRNECEVDVTVTVNQKLALVLTIPVPVARSGTAVRLASRVLFSCAGPWLISLIPINVNAGSPLDLINNTGPVK